MGMIEIFVLIWEFLATLVMNLVFNIYLDNAQS